MDEHIDLHERPSEKILTHDEKTNQISLQFEELILDALLVALQKVRKIYIEF